jgi:hypothetical protein
MVIDFHEPESSSITIPRYLISIQTSYEERKEKEKGQKKNG